MGGEAGGRISRQGNSLVRELWGSSPCLPLDRHWELGKYGLLSHQGTNGPGVFRPEHRANEAEPWKEVKKNVADIDRIRMEDIDMTEERVRRKHQVTAMTRTSRTDQQEVGE